MARVRGIKRPHPLGSVASRSGVAQLTAESGFSAASGFTAADGVKISELPWADAATATDQLEVNQGGTSRRVTVGQVVEAARADDPPVHTSWYGTGTDAINAALAAGAGGVVYLDGANDSTGTINVPAGTAFIGAGIGSIKNPSTTGSVINVRHTTGPAVLIGPGARIDGINFWYPDQVTTAPPIAYDFTIEANHSTADQAGGHNSGLNLHNIWIYNAYKGINLGGDFTDFTPGTGLVSLFNIRLYALHTGVYHNSVLTEFVVSHCVFTAAFWTASSGTAARQWSRTDGVGYWHIAGGQGPQMSNCQFYGHNRAIYLSNPSVSLANGTCTFFKASNCLFDGIRHCVEVADNMALRSAVFTGCTFAGADAINPGFTDGRGFLSNSNNAQIVTFQGCHFDGTYGTHVDLLAPGTAVNLYTFSGCLFYNANASSAVGTHYNILVNDSRAHLLVSGCRFYNPDLPAQAVCIKLTSAGQCVFSGLHFFDTASKPFEVTTVTQSLTVSGVYSRSTVASTWPTTHSLAIASAASITLPEWDFPFCTITGSTGITAITPSWPGRRIILKFGTGQVLLTDGGNLKLNGDFLGADASTLTLICDGTDWYEAGRAGESISRAITIAGGVIAVSGGVRNVILDTEAAAAADDLDTITYTGGRIGDSIRLRSTSAARDVTVKDGTGNLNLAGDFLLGTSQASILLTYNGVSFDEAARSTN